MPREARLTGLVKVAVGILVDADGRVLINQRLPGTHLEGRWEFPGGKLEANESVTECLERELSEELGIEPLQYRPLIRLQHAYPDKSVQLDCWRIERWKGTATAQEGHPIVWVHPSELQRYDLVEADRPIVASLRLPARYAITPDGTEREIMGSLQQLLASGHKLIQLRTAIVETLAAQAVAMSHECGAELLLNADAAFAARMGAGVHLNSLRLHKQQSRPALASGRLCAASCHTRGDLLHAARIGCDFAVLGPVMNTPSHPDASPMGWAQFAATVDCAGIPVFALGGMNEHDLSTAWSHHAQGIAGISAWRV